MSEVFLTILLPITSCLLLMMGLFAFALFGPDIYLWKCDDEDQEGSDD